MTLNKVFRIVPVLAMLAALIGRQDVAFAQTPDITVRFANPQNDCATLEYCLDMEFKADMTGQEVFGMNVRFFYDDSVLEFVDFRDFQGGYGPVAPNPPIILTSEPAGPALFNFAGAAEFVNGAIQLVSPGEPPVVLDTAEWTKLFQVCFLVDDPNANLDTFCPSIVFDLEQDPSNGGYLTGDDGIVITVVDPDPNGQSLPAYESVAQFNWEYIGNGTPPYGQPVDSVCSNINCALPLTLLAFNGAATETGNLLNWQTNDESNFLGFQVQRSVDLVTWKDLGFVPGEGNADEIHAYQYLDVSPDQGTDYYRLKLSDHDGMRRHSGIISIRNTKTPVFHELTVYPNPVKDGRIFVWLTRDPEPGSIVRLLDYTGRVIIERLISQSGMDLDVRELPSGVYLVWVITGSQRLVTRIYVD